MTTGSSVTDQRSRIVDHALGLMSERGAAGTSMRRLANSCGLNVATIYHYFPSKDDLLRAVIEERRYGDRLTDEEPLFDTSLPARDRLEALLELVWSSTEPELPVLRLLLGEGVRGHPTAREAISELISLLDDGLGAWMARGFPELANRQVSPEVAGRLLRRHLLALVAEQLATGSVDGRRSTADLADVLFG